MLLATDCEGPACCDFQSPPRLDQSGAAAVVVLAAAPHLEDRRTQRLYWA